MKTLIAEQGKVWAYTENGEEIILGTVLYLGKNDNGERYYQVEYFTDKEVQGDAEMLNEEKVVENDR